MTSEHTPAPSSPRAVYGFAVYLLFHTLFIIYVIWTFTPNEILEQKFGLFYLPDKYFALYVPILILTATTIFVFFIYPSMNLILTSEIDNISTVRDKFTIYRCSFRDSNGIECDVIIENDVEWNGIGKFCDLHQLDKNFTGNSNEIENQCDCRIAQKCLLRQNPNHLNVLSKRSRIPAVRDIDPADVYSKIINL